MGNLCFFGPTLASSTGWVVLTTKAELFYFHLSNMIVSIKTKSDLLDFTTKENKKNVKILLHDCFFFEGVLVAKDTKSWLCCFLSLLKLPIRLLFFSKHVENLHLLNISLSRAKYCISASISTGCLAFSLVNWIL